jgi:hypothetical protein
MAAAWFDRLAGLVAANRNAALLVMGTPLVLLLLTRLSGRKRSTMLRSVARASQREQANLEQQLDTSSLPAARDALSRLEASADIDPSKQEAKRIAVLNKQLLDDLRRLQTLLDEERSESQRQQQQQARTVKRQTKRLEQLRKQYVDLQLAVDNALTGNNAVLALPEARKWFLDRLASGDFEQAELIVRNIAEPDYVGQLSRQYAKRLAAMNPEAYSSAMDIAYAEDRDERRIERLRQRAESRLQNFKDDPCNRALLASLSLQDEK